MRIQDELKKKFTESYPYKTELHAHTTPVSTCSDVTSEDAVKLYKGLGYTSLVISNHFKYDYFKKRLGTLDTKTTVDYYLDDYRRAKQAGEECDLNVILAAELCFGNENSNHYLLFGIDEQDLYEIFEQLQFTEKEFYEKYVDESKLLFQAHPFRDEQVLMPPENVDGYEAFNLHPNHNSRPALAARYSKSVGKQFIAGTDFHEYSHEGLTAIRTKFPIKDSHELVKALKENDFIMETDGTLIIP